MNMFGMPPPGSSGLPPKTNRITRRSDHPTEKPDPAQKNAKSLAPTPPPPPPPRDYPAETSTAALRAAGGTAGTWLFFFFSVEKWRAAS